MAAWEKAGLALTRNEMISPTALHAAMQRGDAPVVLDVRLPSEWMALRIGTVVNLPLNQLESLAAKLDPTQPVVAVCNSAYRSSMAVGILERKGFKQASSLAGGSQAWIEAGLPVFEASTSGAAASGAKRVVNLPDRMSADALQRLMKDLPGTFDLVDIRPAEQFADYSLPGARNVDLTEVLSQPAFLTGAGPLILVDRDGSLAMAVGGILSQKTERPIKVLYGGLEAYWQETEFGASPPAVRPCRRQPGVAASVVRRAAAASAACAGQETKRGMLIMKPSNQNPMNPYLAGVLLGLVLLASFLILGAGLGASGGLARLSAFAESAVAPEHVRTSEYFGRWGEHPLSYYLVFMLAGTFSGRTVLGHAGGAGESGGGERSGHFRAQPSAAGDWRRGSGRLRQPAGAGLHVGTGLERQRAAAFGQPRVPRLSVCGRVCRGVVRQEAMA